MGRNEVKAHSWWLGHASWDLVKSSKESTEGLGEVSRLDPDIIVCVILAGVQGLFGPSSSAMSVKVATLDDRKHFIFKTFIAVLIFISKYEYYCIISK